MEHQLNQRYILILATNNYIIGYTAFCTWEKIAVLPILNTKPYCIGKIDLFVKNYCF